MINEFLNKPDERFPLAAFIPYPITFGNHAYILQAFSN
jgi:hypothetical protein